MKRIVCSLLALVLLCGCANANTVEIFRLVEPEEYEAASTEGYAYVWEITPPDRGMVLQCWVEYYRDGAWVGLNDHRVIFPTFFAGGRLEVTMKPVANSYHDTDMGWSDFFDNATETEWTVRYRDDGSDGSTVFSTGYDFWANEEGYDQQQWQVHSVNLVDYASDGSENALFSIVLGSDLADDLDFDPDSGELISGSFAYAYVFKAAFTQGDSAY